MNNSRVNVVLYSEAASTDAAALLYPYTLCVQDMHSTMSRARLQACITHIYTLSPHPKEMLAARIRGVSSGAHVPLPHTALPPTGSIA